jgi:secondary thiamine-phosphate synthase enzyme
MSPARFEGRKLRRVGKANGSRGCAPADKLRVPTKVFNTRIGGHGEDAFAHDFPKAVSMNHIFRSAPSTVSADTIVSSLLTVQTSGPGFVDLTAEVAKFVKDAGAKEGAVTLFIRHTSASLTIQENADPSVLDDLMTALDRLAPEDAGWTHDAEGPDDMPAHVKTMLTASSLQIPVLESEPVLGTWQAIYLIEHRRRPHRREIVLQFIGARG